MDILQTFTVHLFIVIHSMLTHLLFGVPVVSGNGLSPGDAMPLKIKVVLMFPSQCAMEAYNNISQVPLSSPGGWSNLERDS